MVVINETNIFVNSDLVDKSESEMSYRAVNAFIKRLMLDLTEMNTEEDHSCSNDCKTYFDLIVGGVDDYGSFEKCVPRLDYSFDRNTLYNFR